MRVVPRRPRGRRTRPGSTRRWSGRRPRPRPAARLVGLADRGHRAELGRPAPGPRSGPTWRIDSPTSTRHSGRSLAASRLSSSLRPLAERTGPSPSPFFGARVNRGARSEVVLGEAEHVALVGDHAGVEQRDRRLVAESLDVEGAAARDVEHPLAHLRRAALVVGAAEVLVALLLLDQRRAAGRAGRGHLPRRAGPWAAAPSTGPTISGITSPALRRTTVSPGRTSLRFTSWALCRVAFSTVEPATLVGSITPYGVTRPVRPVLTRISSSLALTSSGGYLNAIAQRGAREVEPSRRCRETSSTLITTPSISCSTSWRCSP